MGLGEEGREVMDGIEFCDDLTLQKIKKIFIFKESGKVISTSKPPPNYAVCKL